MAAGVIGARRAWSPGANARVDWSHPLATRLEAVFMAAGGNWVDLTGRGYSASTRNSSPVRTSSQFGDAINSASGSWSGTNTAGLADTGPQAMMCVGYLANTGGVQDQNFVFKDSDYIVRVTTPSTLRYYFWRNGALNSITGSTSMSQKQIIVISDVSGSQTMWVNGDQTATGTVTGTGTFRTQQLTIGGFTNSQFWNGSNNLFVYWRRALTAADAATLTADPYCFLRF